MKHHSSRLGRKEGIAGLLLVTPQIIYFLVFFLLPLGICVYAGFTNWNILSPLRKFVGLRNFDKLFSDPKFWTACKNTLYYLIPIPFYLTFALAFAYSCHKRILGEKVFRVLYYLPFISSIVALTLIWKWLFNAKYGLVNLFLGLFGIAAAYTTNRAWIFYHKLAHISTGFFTISPHNSTGTDGESFLLRPGKL